MKKRKVYRGWINIGRLPGKLFSGYSTAWIPIAKDHLGENESRCKITVEWTEPKRGKRSVIGLTTSKRTSN